MDFSNVVAFDTETTLIPDRTSITSKSGRAVNTSPYETPKLVLGSVADGKGADVAPTYEYVRWIKDLLSNPDMHLVAHNLAFDLDVLRAAGLDWSLVERAVEEGRLHDTMYLDLLYRIATGQFDEPHYNPTTKKWAPYPLHSRSRPGSSLDALAQRYLGRELDKNPHIRLGYGQFLGQPIAALPREFIDYAKQDAEATYDIFVKLMELYEELGAKHLLSENLQVKAALAIHEMDKRGVAVNRPLAGKLLDEFKKEMLPLQHRMVEIGLGQWKAKPNTTTRSPALSLDRKFTTWTYQDNMLQRFKVTRKGKFVEKAEPSFHTKTKAIQALLAPFADTDTPTRKDGSLALEYDYWHEKLPKSEERLQEWLKYGKLQKVINTYLDLYSRCDEVFPRWFTIGARSGRMAAGRPNLQNIPKRRAGIRALFVPRPGKRFIRADYSAMEMYTLAEVLAHRDVRGPLYDILTKTDADIHREGAALVLGKQPEDVTGEERQGQKVLHFGVPGGLGPTKLADYAHTTYGVSWTVEEAKKKRAAFLDKFWDIQAYLNFFRKGMDYALRQVSGKGKREWAQQLGITDWNVLRAMVNHPDPDVAAVGIAAERLPSIELPTGLRRSKARFTEVANTGFQGLAAAVLKEALWRCQKAGLRTVLVVHDEIVVETYNDPGYYEGTKQVLAKCMLTAFSDVCPELGPHAGVEIEGPLDCWGKATDLDGKPLDII